MADDDRMMKPSSLPLNSSGYAGATASANKSANMIQQASYAQPYTIQAQAANLPEGVTDQAAPAMPPHAEVAPPTGLPLPTELARTTHPPHRVAPPDILYIEALRLVPRGPYKLSAMEVLQIEVSDTLPRQEIKGLYMISPEGNINLGFTYGSVRIGGLTVDQAQLAIRTHLAPIIKNANVNVTLVQMRGMQNIKGEHVVRPDGTVSLGMYGSVFVAGMTLGQVKCVIENHLAAYLIDPQVTVDVFAYNSRKIYIIADGAGYGQQVIALPATGGETVLDAISRVQGLPTVASLKKIWVARPSPVGNPCSQVLPVDWKAITQAGRTETNYQLMPGDRIYIHADSLITAYNYIDKMVAPVERIFGVLFLGTSTINAIRSGSTTTGVVVR
jgi:protein involved in polysaccharide export with SLBB domain